MDNFSELLGGTIKTPTPSIYEGVDPIPPSPPLPSNVKDLKIDPSLQNKRDEIARQLRQVELDQGDLTQEDLDMSKKIGPAGGGASLSKQPGLDPIGPSQDNFSSLLKNTTEQVKQDNNFSSLIAPKEGKVEAPSYPESYVLGIDQWSVAADKTLAAAVQLYPLVPQDILNKASDYLNKQAERLKAQMPSEESQAEMNWSKSFIKTLGGMTPTLLAMTVTKSPYVNVLMSPISGIGAQLEQTEQGLSTGAGTVSGAIEAAANAAASAIPFFGSSPLRAAVIAAVVNPVVSMFTDAVNKVIKENTDGNEKFGKAYNPFDWEQRSIEAVISAVTAGYGKHLEIKGTKQALRDWTTQNVFPEVENILTDLNRNVKSYDYSYYKNSFADPNDAWHAFRKDLDQNAYFDPSNHGRPVWDEEKLPALLDFISQHPDTPDQERLANFYRSMWEFYATDVREFFDGSQSGTSGMYDPATSTLILGDKALKSTALHEFGHIITNNVFSKAETMLRLGQKPQTPEGERIIRMVQDLDELYKQARLDIVEDMYKNDPAMKGNIDLFKTKQLTWRQALEKIATEEKLKGNTSKLDELYGLVDYHEFASELFTQPEFRKILKNYKVSPELEAKYKTNSETRGASKFLLGDSNLSNRAQKSYLDLAVYHVANVFDTLSGGKRYHPDNVSVGSYMLKDLFKSGKDIEEIAKTLPQMSPEERFGKLSADRIVRQLASFIELAPNSPVEVMDKFGAMYPHQEWKDLVKKFSNDIYKNYDKINALYPRFVDDPAYNKGGSQDLRITKHALEDIFKGKVTKEDDIKAGGTLVMGSDQLSLIKDQNRGGKFVSFFNDKVNQYRTLKAQLRMDFLYFQKSYVELPEKSKINVERAAAYWDDSSGRNQLVQQNLWWPTEQMLRQQNGLNDAEVKAYLDKAAGYDKVYASLDAAGKTLGLRQLDGSIFQLKRIPGFMPHLHDGQVKVLLHIQGSKSYLKGFDTIIQANHYIKKVQKQNNPDITIVPDDNGNLYHTVKNRSPQSNGLVSTLIEHYESYKSTIGLAPDIAKVLADLDIGDIRGYSPHLLERQNVSGYANELYKANSQIRSYLGIFRNKQARDAFGIYERYVENVADFVVNAYFVKDVIDPILQPHNPDTPVGGQNIMKEMPNLLDYIVNQAKNFTGENKNIFKPLDDAFEALGEKLGMHPHFFKFLNRGVRGLFSTFKLRTVRNWWANAQQPMNAIGMLYHFSVSNGLVPVDPSGKGHNPFTSLAWAYDQLAGGMTPEGKAVIEYGKANHIINPQQDMNFSIVGKGRVTSVLDKMAFGGVNMAVEGVSRSATFLASYHYMKQFYHNPTEALGAADRATRGIMVNYDRASRPHIFQTTGIAGEAMSVFAIFRNAYLGNTYLMIRDMYRNPTKINAYKPFVMGQMMYILQAGLVGAIGVSEYNVLAELWNKLFGPDLALPSVEEFVAKYNLPDFIAFGAASEASKQLPGTPEGFYAGASANAPGLTNIFTPPIIPFIQALITFGMIPVKEGMALLTGTPGSSSDDMFKALRQILPPNFVPILNYYMGSNPNVGTRATSLEGHVDLTQSDLNSTMIYGATGLNEWLNRRAEEILNRHSMTMKSMVKGFVNKVVDKQLGGPLGMTMEDAFEKAHRWDPSLTYDEFDKAVKQEVVSRLTSKQTRENSTGTAAQRYEAGEIRRRYGF